MREILSALQKQEIDESNDANSAHKNGSVNEAYSARDVKLFIEGIQKGSNKNFLVDLLASLDILSCALSPEFSDVPTHVDIKTSQFRTFQSKVKKLSQAYFDKMIDLAEKIELPLE